MEKILIYFLGFEFSSEAGGKVSPTLTLSKFVFGRGYCVASLFVYNRQQPLRSTNVCISCVTFQKLIFFKISVANMLINDLRTILVCLFTNQNIVRYCSLFYIYLKDINFKYSAVLRIQLYYWLYTKFFHKVNICYIFRRVFLCKSYLTVSKIEGIILKR